MLACAFSLGLSLIVFGGWWLLLIGMASVLCAWIYTGGPYPLAYNGLGDVFVVLFFGLIAVGCTFYVQTGYMTLDVILLGLACGLAVNNILVVNNYRDIDEDRQAGKRTLVVLFGRRWALVQYAASLIIAGGVLIWLFFQGYGGFVLLGTVPLSGGFLLLRKLHSAQSAEAYLSSLKAASLIVVAYSTLSALGLWIG